MGCLNKYTKFMRISTVPHTPAIFNFQADCLSILSMVFTLIRDVEFAKVERFVYSLSSCTVLCFHGINGCFCATCQTSDGT